MNNSDLGPSIVGTQGQVAKKRNDFRRGRLAEKYGVGGSVGQNKVHKVMHEFKHGELHSGSKKGPKVTDRKQAIAIALSEKRRLLAGKYAGGGGVNTIQAPGGGGITQRPYESGGFWSQLQREIALLTPKTAIAPTSTMASQPGVIPNQPQGQPSAPMGTPTIGKRRGGRV